MTTTTKNYVGRMTHTTTHMAAVPLGLTAQALGAVSNATGRAAQGLESSSRWLDERANRTQESVKPEHKESQVLITPPFDEPFNEPSPV